jgi:undecaprenyl-diphosphatase
MKKYWLPILSMGLFLILAVLVFVQNNVVIAFDKIIESFFTGIHNQFFDKFFIEITRIGDIIPVSIFIFLIASVLFISKKYTKAKMILLSSGLGISAGSFVKIITERIRPENAMIDTIGSSFPSNHAIIAITLCLFFIYEFAKYIKIKWLKISFIIFIILIFSLLVLSRLVLNVHWTSDVIAGILIGITCFSISRIVLENH